MAVSLPGVRPRLPRGGLRLRRNHRHAITRMAVTTPRTSLDNDAANAIIHYYDSGCEVVVFTARPDEHLPEIREWLRQMSLSDYVYEVTNRKPRCCLYFDDRAVRWPLDG